MKTLLSWSTGKDSAWSLHVLRQDPTIEVCGLFTTVNAAFGRVAMHATRREIVQAQAAAAALPLIEIAIPYPCPNEDYERAMADFVAQARTEGIGAMAFGDLYLEDIRAYREKNLAGSGIEPLFPVWGRDTGRLAREMVEGGLRGYVTCVDPRQLDPSFAGRAFDDAFLDALPEGVDPCGEAGEFHTCVVAGPMLARPIPVRRGEIRERDGFVFADLTLST